MTRHRRVNKSTMSDGSIMEGNVLVETRSDVRASDEVAVTVETVTIRGRVLDTGVDAGVITFLAAAPADRRGSFSGSGLPFSSAAQAMHNTPNRGKTAIARDGTFEIRLKAPPNSYYAGVGTLLVPPCVQLMYTCIGRPHRTAIKLADVAVPFRLLTYPATRTGPMFYYVPEQKARTQETIFREGAYPITNLAPTTFWGLKTPL